MGYKLFCDRCGNEIKDGQENIKIDAEIFDGKRIETFPHKIENLIYEEPQKSVEYKKCQIKVNNFVLDVYVHHQDLERLFNYLQEEYENNDRN